MKFLLLLLITSSFAQTRITVTRISDGKIVAGDEGNVSIEKLKQKMIKKRGFDITDSSKFSILEEDISGEEAEREQDRNDYKEIKCNDIDKTTTNGKILKLICKRMKGKL